MWSAASVYKRDCRVTPEKNGAARRAPMERHKSRRASRPRRRLEMRRRRKNKSRADFRSLPRDTYARSRASDAERNRALGPPLVIAMIEGCHESSCACMTLARTLAHEQHSRRELLRRVLLLQPPTPSRNKQPRARLSLAIGPEFWIHKKLRDA